MEKIHELELKDLCLSSQRTNTNNGNLIYTPGTKKKALANDINITCNEWRADRVTMAHLFKNGGFQFIIALSTTELSHFIIITLQFLVFFLNTKQHDLLFASTQCFSQRRQYKTMPLKLFPVGSLEKGKV